MIVLDTNVVSEPMRRAPNPAVIHWLDNQPRGELYLCAPVLAEVCYGIARLEESQRKLGLRRSYEKSIVETFEGRILLFDAQAAEAYGELLARLGQAIDVIDAMIAAIALSNSATLATRNMAHFAHTGLTLVDPFGAST